VGQEMYRVADADGFRSKEGMLDPKNIDQMFEAGKRAKEPLRAFLMKKVTTKDRSLFYSLALKMRKVEDRKGIEDKDFLILVPAFVVSELKEAFQIGFLLFVPFIVIDIVVANILLALGMQMLSPTTISMPFKLLLFVMIDGWYLISKGLVVGYL
jgi:type III secretion protein R